MNTAMKTLTRISWICTLCCLLSATKVAAQSTFGTIIGTVTDASGAVVAGAKAEALNQATGGIRTVLTDSSGEYQFLNVEPGHYTIAVTAAQFAVTKDEDVIVLARDTARSDIRLQVQGAQQSVVVEAGQSVVSEDFTISTSRSGDEISSLPLNFRASNAPSPIETAALTPGVNQDQSGNLTFSGQLPTATSFSLDGSRGNS
jgi:VCBS repeat-containing protein